MPCHASPIKCLRSDRKKKANNKSRMSALRTFVKKAREGKQEGDLKKAQKALASAASRGVIHRNTASRKISRLMRAAAKV